jgi:hypothetical protein
LIVHLFDLIFVEKVRPDVGLELVRKILLQEVSVKFSHVLFVDFFGLSNHVDERSDVIDKKAENHAAHDFDE